ncbi:ankyrin repeat-containing domain protein [Coprinopsis sp. MPI-PUGE-AT-0042]|nr:ankyrin repeat-containing domain protein [Coprinopsis sp. MPI-PUGE-AT-0042]
MMLMMQLPSRKSDRTKALKTFKGCVECVTRKRALSCSISASRSFIAGYDLRKEAWVILSGHFKRSLRFIDGLDEAHIEHRSEILSILATIDGNFMVTSRPLSLLGEVLEGPQVTFININPCVDDIERMASKGIDHSTSLRRLLLRHKLKEKVVSRICAKFLYASLQLKMIKHCTNRKSVLERLERTPQDLNSLYAQTMQRIMAQPDEHADLATRALLWVGYACRPLDIQELRHAVACEPASNKFDWTTLVDENEFISVRLVRFCHHTARKPLVSLLAKIFLDPHAVLAQGCILYLDALKMNDITIEQWSTFDNILNSTPFLGYALTNWSSHLRQSNGLSSMSKQAEASATRFLVSCRSYPLQYAERRSPFDLATSPIHVAAFVDTVYLLDSSSIEEEVSHITQRRSSALFLAASQGNHQSLEHLRLSHIHVNARNSQGKTALHAAFLPGLKGLECLEALLTHPAININARDSTGRTPLMEAADQPCDLKSRNLVLERFIQMARGVDINAVDHSGDTALTLCLRRANLPIAKSLLQCNEIDINIVNKAGLSSFDYAGKIHGIEGQAITQELLQRSRGMIAMAPSVSSSPWAASKVPSAHVA